MLAKALKSKVSVLILSTIISIQLATAKNDEFDFIIYGGGTTGSVLARRLSDNPLWKVLLLETGRDGATETDIPLNVNRLPLDCTNSFGYKYEKSDNYCLAMKNKQCLVQAAKNIGGHSLIGDMIYSRGNREDFDSLSDQGNPGWSFEKVLPFFKKLENNEIPDCNPEYCGTRGPVTISYPKYRTKLASVFLNAGKELKYPTVNYNENSQTGFSLVQTTLKDGLRQNAYNAYLKPVVGQRPNLVIRKNVMFTKLIFNKNRCQSNISSVVGVEYKQFGFAYTVTATREVILAASAIGNARYLMVSGIGPADHLKELGIKVIQDLPVGQNLHEVVGVGGLTFVSDIKVPDLQAEFTPNNLLAFLKSRKGPLSSTVIEALAFLESSNACPRYPDYELTIRSGSLLSMPVRRERYNVDENVYSEYFSDLLSDQANVFTILPTVLRPKSRGRILLRSANPNNLPIIEGNFYSDPADMKVVLEAIKTTLLLVETKAFKKINTQFYNKLFAPCAHFKKEKNYNADDDDAYWECFARHWTFPLERRAGTTKMGPACDKTAVVDAKLKVHGVRNLRVVGTTVLPQQISGHVDAVKYMIAEKAADIIYRCNDKTRKNKTRL